MVDLFSTVMWRNSKEDVAEEVNSWDETPTSGTCTSSQCCPNVAIDRHMFKAAHFFLEK